MNLRLLRKSSLAIPLNPPLSDSIDAAENPTKATPSLSASALVCVVALMLLAAALTIPGLNADPIWIDEYWSIYNAGGAHYGPLSPAEIFARIATEDIWHVPLYYLLIAGWSQLAG